MFISGVFSYIKTGRPSEISGGNWNEREPYDVHLHAAAGQSWKTVDWSGSVFRRAWQRNTGAPTEFAFTGTTVFGTYWLRAWCHGTTFPRRPEGTMSVKTKYPHFRLKEPRVVRADRLIYRKTSPNCQRGIFWGAWLSLMIGRHCVTLLRHPIKFWTSDVHVTLLCSCACVCLRAGPNMSVNHSKFVSPGEDPETRRMRTVKNIADLRQNLEETMSSLRGTQISHR